MVIMFEKDMRELFITWLWVPEWNFDKQIDAFSKNR